MPKTERRGPFFLEWNGDLVVIRCKYPFKAIRTREIEAVQQGIGYVTLPIAMNRDVKLTLKGEGLPTEEIDGGGAA